MQNFPFFRRKLAHRLRNCAARRRVTCADDPTGEDLKVLALFDRLARQAEQLPQVLIDDVAQRCADPAFARRFDQVWDTLSDALGILVVPRDAADLVRWMLEQAQHDPDPEIPAIREKQPGHSAPMQRNLLTSVLADFTGALAVAGPMFAVEDCVTAVSQSREQAFASSHLSTSATVVAVTPGQAGRAAAPNATEVLAFTPLGERLPCRVSVPLGFRHPDALGQTLTIVPRSGACEAPVVPGVAGDPATSGFIALIYLAGGLASLKACVWLRRHSRTAAKATTRPARMQVAL